MLGELPSRQPTCGWLVDARAIQRRSPLLATERLASVIHGTGAITGRTSHGRDGDTLSEIMGWWPPLGFRRSCPKCWGL